MNGIKLGLNCTRAAQGPTPELIEQPLYALLSDDCINIEFLNIDFTHDHHYISCCIAKEHDRKANELTPQVSCGMNTLSVYPHRSSINHLACLVRLMSQKKILFSDLATSGSMLTFVVDTRECTDICDYLAQNIDLPKSRTPFQQELNPEDKTFIKERWPETTATYVEKKIKTYGINIQSGLELYSLKTGFEHLAPMARIIESAAPADTRFYFSSAHTRPENEMAVWHFVTDNGHHHLKDQMARNLDKSTLNRLKITSNMALISLQGPHYGDRYGIAAKAMAALNSESVPLPLAGFTGACIYLVTADNWAEPAKKALLKFFERP